MGGYIEKVFFGVVGIFTEKYQQDGQKYSIIEKST
jgi:hypothetical protein